MNFNELAIGKQFFFRVAIINGNNRVHLYEKIDHHNVKHCYTGKTVQVGCFEKENEVVEIIFDPDWNRNEI
jgi:hypothetical protein